VAHARIVKLSALCASRFSAQTPKYKSVDSKRIACLNPCDRPSVLSINTLRDVCHEANLRIAIKVWVD
jgi:hypothetical protein